MVLKSEREFKNDCTCGHYRPYKPHGVCAPIIQIGACINCHHLNTLTLHGYLHRDDVIDNPNGDELIQSTYNRFFNDQLIAAVSRVKQQDLRGML